MTRALPIVLILLLAPTQLFAQPANPKGMFDVIPKEASAAIVLRSIHDFKIKSAKLLKDIDLPLEEEPGKLVAAVYKFLTIEGGVDEKAPVVLTILHGKAAGVADFESMVLMIPIADRAKILAGFRLKKLPKDHEIFDLENTEVSVPRMSVVVRGKYLCVGLPPDALKRLTDDSLVVSAAEKQQFADADILLYLGKRAWPLVWGDYLGKLDGYFGRRKDEEERRVGQQFIKGLRATQHSFVSLRIDDGIRLRSNMVFDIKDKAAREMLDMLKAGTSRFAVKGLPDGRAMAALGWAGDGSKNGILTKLFFDVFLEGPLPGSFNNLPIFASTDYPSVVAVTHDLSQRLKGVRMGLYHNLNEKELGLFSAVAVIDTANGPAFLKEIRTLTKIANLTEADLKLPEIQKLIDLEQLARELNSGTFSVRQSAATRLLLIGQPALPHLQKVLDKPLSLEQRRRAEGIKADIDRAAEQGRKDLLLPKEMPKALRATFTIAPDVEKRDGMGRSSKLRLCSCSVRY